MRVEKGLLKKATIKWNKTSNAIPKRTLQMSVTRNEYGAQFAHCRSWFYSTCAWFSVHQNASAALFHRRIFARLIDAIAADDTFDPPNISVFCPCCEHDVNSEKVIFSILYSKNLQFTCAAKRTARNAIDARRKSFELLRNVIIFRKKIGSRWIRHRKTKKKVVQLKLELILTNRHEIHGGKYNWGFSWII